MKKLYYILILILWGFNLHSAEEFRLSNGVPVVYHHIPKTKIVSVQLWMKTGSYNEDEKINGISHFLEHMVFKGTDKFKPDDIDKIVESKGGQMNAGTSKDYTFYYITIPNFNVETAFDVISEMVFNAKFVKDEIEKERPVIVQEINRKYDDPTHDMWTYVYEAVFNGTPYAYEVIGTEENVNSFTREQFLEYYNKFYHPENMTLVVTGDIKLEDVKLLSNKYFSKTKSGSGYAKSNFTPSVLKKNTDKIFKKDVSMSYGTIVYAAPNLISKEKYTLEVISEILSGGEHSLLNQELKNKNGLTLSIYGGYLGMKQGGAFIYYYVAPEENETKIKEELKKNIDNLISGNIDTDMIIRAKNRLKSSVVFQREKSSSEARDIGYAYTLGIKDFYYNYTENIEKVTLNDIMAVSKEIFSKEYLFVKTEPDKNSKANK